MRKQLGRRNRRPGSGDWKLGHYICALTATGRVRHALPGRRVQVGTLTNMAPPITTEQMPTITKITIRYLRWNQTR
jgi:hypothetical protein